MNRELMRLSKEALLAICEAYEAQEYQNGKMVIHGRDTLNNKTIVIMVYFVDGLVSASDIFKDDPQAVLHREGPNLTLVPRDE